MRVIGQSDILKIMASCNCRTSEIKLEPADCGVELRLWYCFGGTFSAFYSLSFTDCGQEIFLLGILPEQLHKEDHDQSH